MLLDGRERFVVSSVGWVEHGGLVRRDLSTGKVVSFPSGEAEHVRLFAVDGERFVVAGHAGGRGALGVSVRTFESPGEVLWSLRVSLSGAECSSDPGAARGIPRHHLATLREGDRWEHRLVTVDADGAGAHVGDLPWYNHESYDLGYQGLVDAVALPGTALVLISVQRSSSVVVHDPVARREVGRIELEGMSGNPLLTIVGNELWTVDYDTFVRVDLAARRVVTSVRVQPPGRGDPSIRSVMNLFAGDLFAWAVAGKAVIPRPYSGDVVIVDPQSGAVERAVRLGRQPLRCVVTREGRIVARDWKTGDWLEGAVSNEKRPWWRRW